MIVSALLPSRGRPDLLRRSIRSLFLMADRPLQVEVLVAVDPDDPESHEVAVEEGARVLTAPQRYGYQGLHMYFNALAERAGGEWLLLWNDDARMVSAAWEQEMASKPPGILSIHSNHDPYLVFPAIHRCLYKAMGHFSLSNHNDTWLYEVAVGAGCLIDTRIQAFHDRYDLTGNNNDEIYRTTSTGYRTVEFYGPELSQKRAEDIQKVIATLEVLNE